MGSNQSGIANRTIRKAVDTIGVGRPARWLWTHRPGTAEYRRFAAWIVDADRADNERMRLVMASVLKEDSNCVDIGAGGGDVLADMVKFAPAGRHIAYEPLVGSRAILKQRFPFVDARSTAVGGSPGTTTFVNVRNAPGWSGFRGDLTHQVHDADLERITVTTVRLDDDLPDDFVPTLIKMDVNGAEAEAIEGAIETIRNHRPVLLFEHGRAAGFYGTSSTTIFELLAGRCGLRIFDLSGEGPLTVDSFRDTAQTKWNFLARP